MGYRIIKDSQPPSTSLQKPAQAGDALRAQIQNPDEFTRGLVGGAIRGVEQLAGSPVTLLNLPSNIVNLGSSLLGYGNVAPTLEIGSPEWIRENVTKKLTGETWEPKGTISQIGQGVGSTTGALIGPGKFVKGLKFISPQSAKAISSIPGLRNISSLPLSKALPLAASGEAARFSADAIGLPEGIQELAKLGGMAAYSLVPAIKGRQPLIERARGLYAQRDKSLESLSQKDALLNSSQQKPLIDAINKAKSSLPISKAKWGDADKELGSVIDQIKKGWKIGKKVSAKDLLQLDDFIDQKIGSGANLQHKEKLIKGIRSASNESLREWGKNYPDFLIPHLQANEIYGANAAAQYIQDVTPRILAGGGGTVAAIQAFLQGPLNAVLYGGGALGLGKGLSEGIKFAQKMIKSPLLRKEYTNLIKAASDQQYGATLNSLNKLAKEYKKEDSKPKKGFRIIRNS